SDLDAGPAAGVEPLALVAGVGPDFGIGAEAEEVLHREAVVLHAEPERQAAVRDGLGRQVDEGALVALDRHQVFRIEPSPGRDGLAPVAADGEAAARGPG